MAFRLAAARLGRTHCAADIGVAAEGAGGEKQRIGILVNGRHDDLEPSDGEKNSRRELALLIV